MSPLWRADELVKAMGGRPVGTMPDGVGGISIDTRSLVPGDAFFAIRGEVMDGHDFATAAVKAGASLLVVAEGKLPALGRLTAPMIVVPDVLANAGGVVVSYAEWIQNTQNVAWERRRVDEELSRRMLAAHRAVHERSVADGCSLRSAAYRVALSRVARVVRLRGYV